MVLFPDNSIRSLCRFLEEALCNVGKYAVGATRLTVTCGQEEGWQVIRVVDNGIGLIEESEESIQQTREKQIKNLLFFPLKSTQSKIQSSTSKVNRSGIGTKLSRNLAKQLGGTFQRYPNPPKGLICKIKWRPRKIGFRGKCFF